MGAARVGDKGWKKRARELGCESDVTAYEEAKKRHMTVKVAAEHGAVDAFQLRSYREGQQKMRQDKARIRWRCLRRMRGRRARRTWPWRLGSIARTARASCVRC